jgi:hypothetical protein
MNENPRPKKRIPYWRALVVGFLIPIIGGGLLAGLISYGTFTFWKPFEGPPSGVAQIITIQWDQLGRAWVKANDGTYYSAHLLCTESSTGAPYMCGPEFSFPPWKPVKDISQIPQEKILRGRNCSSLKKGIFPFNPAGPIRECIYTYREGEGGGSLYIALMADGALKFWENEEDRFLWFVSGFLSIVLSFIVAVIISVIYLLNILFNTFGEKIRVRNQHQSDTGSRAKYAQHPHFLGASKRRDMRGQAADPVRASGQATSLRSPEPAVSHLVRTASPGPGARRPAFAARTVRYPGRSDA